MTFEKELFESMKKKVLSEIQSTEFTKTDYTNRKQLPKEFIDKLWQSIDWDEVIDNIKPEIQKRICNSIIGAMETEIKTDVKNILSVDGVRQKLRIHVYPKLMQVLEGE